MTQELRWAARYAFVEDLWRGRARVIVDAELEAVLREGGPGVAHGSDPALRGLVDALLPHDPAEGEAVWMAVASAAVAAELGRRRPGTTFVPNDAIADVLRRAHWDVAMIDLSAAVIGPPDGAVDATTSPDVQDPAFGAGVYLRRALAAVRLLGLGCPAGRSVVLCAPVRDFPRVEDGLEYGELYDLANDALGPPRLFGLYTPPMAAVVDFGESIVDDPTEVSPDLDRTAARVSGVIESDDDDDGDADGEQAALSYDNTLGSQEPALLEYLAVVGANAELPEGLTLIELPLAVSADASDANGGARAQLIQARRRADLAAIEKQDQLERAEELERENAELRRELQVWAELDPAADAADAAVLASPDREAALEAALVREQELKWRGAQLEAQLAEAIARPVSALESELAELRARLDLADGAGALDHHPDNDHRGDGGEVSAPPGPPGASYPGAPILIADSEGGEMDGSVHHGPTARVQRLAARLHGLIVRVERGGIPALALRRELAELRRELLTAR